MHIVNPTAIEKTKFPLGQVVITSKATDILDSSAVSEGLHRHAIGYWGDIPPEDAALSGLALIKTAQGWCRST